MLKLANLKFYPLAKRRSKVKVSQFAHPLLKGSKFNVFLKSLPSILKANDLKTLADNIVKARHNGHCVIFMLGAHVIKCGLIPLINDLIEKDVVTAIALNGAGIIHDFEIAYCGKTSEYVEENIVQGLFGMAEETNRLLNEAISQGFKEGIGLGEAVARFMVKEKFPYNSYSLLAQCQRKKIPVTVHVAIGTDIIHQWPYCNGAAIGETSLRDFHKFVDIVAGLENGVIVNFGSAVLLPEVFLKALNMARNLGHKIRKFTSANFDQIMHYRVEQNLLLRPTIQGGRSFNFVGHHEIMIPLLYASIIEML